MKHLKKVLLILLVVVSFNNINAQDEDNPWAIELGTNAVDFYPTGADFKVPNDGAVVLPVPAPTLDGYLGEPERPSRGCRH